MGTLENHTNLSFIIIFWRLVPQNLRNLLLELALLMDEICYTACPGYYPGHIATFSVNTSKYTLTKYSYCVRIIIVFDKYEDECSTKCQEYSNRSSKGVMAPDVYIRDVSLEVASQKNELLRNTPNKKQLIELLSSTFWEAQIEVRESKGDADTLIAKTAKSCAEDGSTVQ